MLMAELRPEQANNSEAELLAVVRDVVKAVKDGEGIKPHALVLLKVPTPPQLPSTPTSHVADGFLSPPGWKARAILKTTSGKLRRRELREAYLQMAQVRATGAEPTRQRLLIPMQAVSTPRTAHVTLRPSYSCM